MTNVHTHHPQARRPQTVGELDAFLARLIEMLHVVEPSGPYWGWNCHCLHCGRSIVRTRGSMNLPVWQHAD
jgi:hypothetical protein